MDGNPGDLLVTSRTDLERLCDLAGRMGLVQLPLFRAAADGLLALVRIESTSAHWPTSLIERNQRRPICFMLGGDPGFGHPDPAPAEWACADGLRDWCHAAIIHGAAGEADHYRDAAASTMILRRLAFIETTSARAADWHAFLHCPRTLVIVPTTGVHPLPERPEVMQ
jgi:hypothetical protein